jgi:hypothetical protein
MSRYWAWLKRQIVQEVPEDIAACEFDCGCVFECRKNQCASSELRTRERSPAMTPPELVLPCHYSLSWKLDSDGRR